MDITSLRSLLDTLRHIRLWDRIFYWRRVRNQLIDASADLESVRNFSDRQTELKMEVAVAARQLELVQSALQKADLQRNLDEKKIHDLGIQVRDLELEIGDYKNAEESHNAEFSRNMATLDNIRLRIQDERERELEQRHQAEMARISKLRESWSQHELQVKNIIKSICSRHTIEYVDKVPFKGEPDNAVRICGEYVIFDAKSPGSEDLRNFPGYLREQAERARKYTKEDNVRKEVFLVIPASALEVVSNHVFRLGDYSVFVIATDALEPLMLALRRLEDYEFASQLSPEEKENVCRVIGKFAHLSKRRVQIDAFFIRQFMELAYTAENDLPSDMLAKAEEFEKAEKLNPPVEKRAKQISRKELEHDVASLEQQALARGIAPSENDLSEEINKVPLYNHPGND